MDVAKLLQSFCSCWIFLVPKTVVSTKLLLSRGFFKDLWKTTDCQHPCFGYVPTWYLHFIEMALSRIHNVGLGRFTRGNLNWKIVSTWNFSELSGSLQKTRLLRFQKATFINQKVTFVISAPHTPLVPSNSRYKSTSVLYLKVRLDLKWVFEVSVGFRSSLLWLSWITYVEIIKFV